MTNINHSQLFQVQCWFKMTLAHFDSSGLRWTHLNETTNMTQIKVSLDFNYVQLRLLIDLVQLIWIEYILT